jgi:transcriptional regulator of acetoin/glycerol metabolism
MWPVRLLAERDAIITALDQANGIRSKAAELLGMGRTTLWRKMKQYDLDVTD